MRSLKQLQPPLWDIELNDSQYSAQITRNNPSALLFMIDQSASMGFETQPFKGTMMTPAQIVADMVNEMINEVILRCTKSEGVKDYFEVCVIGYGGKNSDDANILWKGNLAKKKWIKLSELKLNAQYQKKEVTTKIRGVVKKKEINSAFWINPVAGYGTPMGKAFNMVHNLITEWIKDGGHEDSFPPIVINITDGAQNDCQNDELIEKAKQVQALNTKDGHTLVLNCHIAKSSNSIIFPLSSAELPHDKYAKSLLEMSSEMPKVFHDDIARVRNDIDIFSGYKGMGFNMDMNTLFNMIDIGTTGATRRITG